jgi:hypothetical protein
MSPVFAKAVIIDGQEYIPINGSKCLSRVYRISKGYIGPANDNVIEHDLRECHKIIGRAPDEYGEFSTWLELFRKWLLNF